MINVLTQIRPAKPRDEISVKTLFFDMLRELEPFGHDILPTQKNVNTFWTRVFLPSIRSRNHGIGIASIDGDVGVILMVPEFVGSEFDYVKQRGIDWGCFVRRDCRRRGIATDLRTWAIERMRESGASKIITHIRTRNIAGVESYRAIGAEFTGYEMEINL